MKNYDKDGSKSIDFNEFAILMANEGGPFHLYPPSMIAIQFLDILLGYLSDDDSMPEGDVVATPAFEDSVLEQIRVAFEGTQALLGDTFIFQCSLLAVCHF